MVLTLFSLFIMDFFFDTSLYCPWSYGSSSNNSVSAFQHFPECIVSSTYKEPNLWQDYWFPIELIYYLNILVIGLSFIVMSCLSKMYRILHCNISTRCQQQNRVGGSSENILVNRLQTDSQFCRLVYGHQKSFTEYWKILRRKVVRFLSLSNCSMWAKQLAEMYTPRECWCKYSQQLLQICKIYFQSYFVL